MLANIIKIILSALIIVIASETAKRNVIFGGLIASIPLISVLAMCWLYSDTKDVGTLISFSYSIFWMVLPSLVLFLSLPIFLKNNINFYLSLLLSSILTILCYGIMVFILEKFGIKL